MFQLPLNLLFGLEGKKFAGLFIGLENNLQVVRQLEEVAEAMRRLKVKVLSMRHRLLLWSSFNVFKRFRQWAKEIGGKKRTPENVK